MRIATREFKPALIPSIVTLLILPILIALGFWQLDRAEQKRVILAAVTQRMQAESLQKIPDTNDIKDARYQRIKLDGKFDTTHLIYVDNKVVFGRVGYYVVSPFLVTNSSKTVLVNLGWIAMGRSRQDIPSVKLPEQKVTISGRIKTNLDNVYSLSDNSFDKVQWPLVVQWTSPKQLSELLNITIQPLIILLDKPKDINDEYEMQFKREWKFISSSPDTHTSYAMQWFSLALVLVLIFIGVNTKKIE
ncbi:MAG: SURF1 family protein [Gammaproteobacteria bacterium]